MTASPSTRIPAPSFDCESCHRTIGKFAGHNVTTDHRIICSSCLVDSPLHAEWYPNCRSDWHDLHDHLRYVHSDRFAVAVVLGVWDATNMSAADAVEYSERGI